MASAQQATNASASPFLQKYRGYLGGIMQWTQLDELWDRVRAQGGDWYIYAVGEEVPQTPATTLQLDAFIESIDALLRREHDEDYCGIVYADDPEKPTLVKIYDPNNLGVVCGYSDNPPLPGWVLSVSAPVDLPQAMVPSTSRKRWWQAIFN
jgi:hypothetical protein